MNRIFISYRRADSEAIVGRIYDRLEKAVGPENVFKDVDDIPPGVDFRKVLTRTINRSDVVLVVIGPQWLNIRDNQGNRRLISPTDYTRIEVEQALTSNRVLVIPTLVMGATMPPADELPPSIRNLAFLNAVSIRHDPDFSRDVSRLIEQIKRSRRRIRFLLPRLAVVLAAVPVIALLAVIGPPLVDWVGRVASDSSTPPVSSSYEVRIDSNAGWLDTGVFVNAGQAIRFRAEGEVNAWARCETEKHEFDVEHIDCRSLINGPEGGELRDVDGHLLEAPRNDLPAPELRFLSLIGRIGSRGEAFQVGSQNQLESPTSGNLQLRINDPPGDNEGEFIVFIEFVESGESLPQRDEPDVQRFDIVVQGRGGWQHTDIRLRAGQQVIFHADGQINFWEGCHELSPTVSGRSLDCDRVTFGPDGGLFWDLNGNPIAFEMEEYPAPEVQPFALIGRVDPNGEILLIGSESAHAIRSDGGLLLRVNEPDRFLGNNGGMFGVLIEVRGQG
jgi:hypothetical protein